ncbi:alpha/beta hydrolase [Mariniluteicoccus endophyticus]
MDMVLIGGLWLTADVWDPVVEELTQRGHRGIAVALPGQGDDNATATLADQLRAVTFAAKGAERPLLVGHSAAASLAWMAADRLADEVAGVVFVGGFPEADGAAYADFFEPVDGWMRFPGWEKFEGPDSADLSAEQKRLIEEQMVGVPQGVSRGTVSLGSEDRFGVPVTVICPEFSPQDAKDAMEGGDAPELAAAQHVELADMNSGHWPMVSCPDQLADVLSAVAGRVQ